MSEALLGGVLPAIYSAGNYAKRQLKNIASDPLGVIQQSLGQMTDTRKQFEDLNRMAYGDPRNPAKITNQAAHDLLQRMATEQMLNMNMGVAGVVKPLKGGAWLDKTVDRMIDDMRPSYSIDDKLSLEKELKKHLQYIEQNKDFPLFDLTHAQAGARDVEDLLKRLPGYTAMHKWLNKNLRNYVKNEMGTPSDSVRKLADEKNKIHLEPTQLAVEPYIEGVKRTREEVGMPVEGMAKTPMGKSWEDRADLHIESEPASYYQNKPSWIVDFGKYGEHKVHTEAEAKSSLKDWEEGLKSLSPEAREILSKEKPEIKRTGVIGMHPWLEKKDPNERIYNLDGGQGLNFKPVTETLLNDIFEGKLPAESLKNVSVAQAVARHSDYQKELATQMAKLEAEQQKKNLSANVHKEYDNGHKWIELPDTMSSAENKEFCKGIGKNLGLCTQNDWAAEDYGRHDVGNRLYALIDQEGKPHAQVQTKHRHFNLRDISNLPAEDQKLINKQVTEWAQNQDEYPTHSRVERAYSDAAKSLGHQLPTDVLEIKPPSNDWKGQYSLDREEKYPGYQEKYKPFLDDFVKSGNYGDVGDLHNTNLFDLHKSTQYADDLRTFGNKFGFKLPRYITNQEADILGRHKLNHHLAESVNNPEIKPIPEVPEELKQYQVQPEPPVQEYKAGGAVQHFDDGGEVTSQDDLSKPFFGNPNIQRQGAIARANAAERSPLTLPDPRTYAAATTALSVPVNMANMIAGGAQALGRSIPEAIKTGQPPAPIAAKLAEKYFSENPGMQPDTPLAAEYQEKLGGLFDAMHVPPVVGDLTFARNVGEVSNPMKMMLKDYMKANPPSVGLATKDPSGKPLSEIIKPAEVSDGERPAQMNMKSGDITQHNLLTQREERQIANSVELTKDELKIIKEGAKAAGVPVSEIEERVRQHKIDNPSVGDDPWAQLELSRIKQLKDKPGEYEIEYKNVPYSYDQDTQGKTIKPGTTEYDTHTTSLADKLKNEVVDIYNRFRGGDEAAGNIIRQAGWYKEMRSRLRQEFGGMGDLFADLLGATSPNTPVRENWKNAVDLIRKASQGDFDALVPQWEDWYKNVETKEKSLNSFFAGQLAEGKTKAAIKRMPEFESQYEELKKAREFPDELLPLKDSGKKYGFNGQNGVRALLDLFRVVKDPNADIGIGTTAPKAITFSGNLIGFKDRATIDVWAARLLQRLAEKIRVPSMAETGVSGAMLPGGTTTGQFGMGQDVFRKAVDLIRKDPELSKLDVLKNISDDDLQALIWFKEKELWTKKNWTSAAGEGGSFEFEADLAGIRDQAEVNRLRKLIDTGVATTKKQKEMAQAEIEDIEAHRMTLRSLMEQAGDSLSPHDLKAMKSHVDDLNKSITRQKAILAKPDPEELMQTKKGAQEQLNTMVRPLERYQAGLSQQSSDFTPTNADQARLADTMQKAIYAGDDGATVMASKSMPTLGIYGAPEHSIDLEAIVRQGYNPLPLLKEIITEAQTAKQHSTFLSKVLRNDEPVDPLRHRPGVEIYFREKGDVSKIQPILDDLKKEGIQFYTVVVDGRRSPNALAGQIPPAVGVRFQLVPEFEQAFDIHDWSKLTDAQIAAEVDKRAIQMADLAATVAKKVPGVSNAGQYWYDTEVLFDHQYQERLNEIENSSRTPGGNATSAGEKTWGGKSIREGVKGAISGPPETTGSTGAVPSGDASTPAVDRINMSHKDVTKRVPELTEAALKVQAGLMSRAEYNDIVTKYKPIEAYKTVPVPPSPKQIISALTKTNAEKPGSPNKSEYFGVPSKVLKEGDRVGIRLDIPSYEKTNTWVVTVHGPQTGKNVYAGAGPRIGYEPVARATNVEFQVQPTGALKIATGKPKSTLATMEGSWKSTTPEEAQKLAKEYLNHKDWTQVGMDPQRHSYFYDRRSGKPLTHADEIIQVGPLVLARNARNLSKPGDFAYKHGGLVSLKGR
jgi:hypothetical protein